VEVERPRLQRRAFRLQPQGLRGRLEPGRARRLVARPRGALRRLLLAREAWGLRRPAPLDKRIPSALRASQDARKLSGGSAEMAA
jgi:hypothetical protein